MPWQDDLGSRHLAGKVHALSLLWRKRFFVLGALIVGAGVGTIYAIFQPPIYASASVIEIQGLNESFLGLNQVDLQGGTDRYSATAGNIQTQTRIMTSDSLKQQVAERLNLELTPILPVPTDLFGKIRNRLGLVAQEPVQHMREAIQMAARTVSARGIGSSRLVQISAESISPEVAARFVNTLAGEYSSHSLQARSAGAVRTMQWIEGQLEETRMRLGQTDTKLQEFFRQTGLDFVTQSSTLDMSKLQQLQADLSAIQKERIERQARWAKAKSAPIDTLPEILDDGRMRSLREELTNLRREKANLMATLGPDHYMVRRIDAQAQELERTLQREKANLVQRIENEYEAALERERMLSEAYNTQASQIVGKSDEAARYSGIVREVETTRRIHDLLLEQLNHALLASALPTDNLRVIDEAKPPLGPTKPQPGRDILMGSFLGGALTFGLFYLLEARRQRMLAKVFASPGHAGELLRIPELGVIPSVDGPSPRGKIFANGHWKSGRYGRVAAGRGKVHLSIARNKSSRHGTDLALPHGEHSLFAESFRLTLASIIGSRSSDWRPIIVVTSPGPGEGKTTVATNLAIATARTGRRVLLVDADWRGARLHRTFKVPKEPGLVELITHDWSGDVSLPADHLRTTEIAGLTLMPAGNGDGDVAGLFGFSVRLSEILERLHASFDVMLVDTAPALYFADARLLGQLSEGIILVVRARATHRDSAFRLTEQFRTAGVPILGTVLNDWKPLEGDDAYSRQYRRVYEAYETPA